MYSYANPTWLVVLSPRGYIDKQANFETIGIMEYKPKISENWRFYSRLQSTIVLTAKNGTHDRSYVYVRAGVRYKEFTFGAGTNLDFYGATKHNINNYGGFVSANLF